MKDKEFCIMPSNLPYWDNKRFNGSHRHEVMFGPHRRKSIEDGLVVFLKPELHNMSKQGVHFNRVFDLELKRVAQKTWCEYYNKTADEFKKRYGRRYD